VVQIGQGLTAAHAAGIVHRDFKPANILVGDDNIVRVLDFAISEARERIRVACALDGAARDPPLPRDDEQSPAEGRRDSTQTNSSAFTGTPAFLTPEALQCLRCDPDRADLFAFGCVLYEALSLYANIEGLEPHLRLPYEHVQAEIALPNNVWAKRCATLRSRKRISIRCAALPSSFVRPRFGKNSMPAIRPTTGPGFGPASARALSGLGFRRRK
jgi:serine/threonine protein kinase